MILDFFIFGCVFATGWMAKEIVPPLMRGFWIGFARGLAEGLRKFELRQRD